MSKVNNLISQRFKTVSEKLSKMTSLVEMSSSGNLSSFSGVFRVMPLNEREQESLHSILNQYSNDTQEISTDLAELSAITAEVKAINNQAILLHGERIKKAQTILKNYLDGAFSSWLIATYGNRQTPYNFLQYYELYITLPSEFHNKLDDMPRQAIYSLASREGPFEKKQEIIQNYQGQPKNELLELIRQTFPLSASDKRAQNLADFTINALRRILTQVDTPSFQATPKQKKTLQEIFAAFKNLTK